MSKFFIEHPIFANVIAIITILLGAVCIWTLPIAQYPDITPPTIQVTTSYPGASAETVAKTIGIPIEQAVNGVENALYMSSTSGSDGSYTLTISFAVGTDLNTSLSLVQNYVNAALSQLPAGVNAQGVTVRKVSTNILLVINVFSPDGTFDETFLANYAIINMQYPLARLPGVGQVKVVGAGEYSMRVWLDPNKLQYYGLTTLDVQNAIQQQNIEVVAGQLGGPPVPKDQAFQFTINALGRLSDVEEFENIIVKSIRGETAQIVRVKDLARVELSQQTFANFSQVFGKPAAHLVFYTLPGANDLAVAKAVLSAVEEMSKIFPKGVQYASVYNTTVFVQQAINSVYHTLFEAAILVLIVIMVFLQNFRAMLVPATTVPVTIIGAFAAMAALGFSINLMTLFALILAIGIVVDDAIIIVENASHYIEKGLTPKDAAIKAMSELTGPVIGITLVLTAVFVPAAFLPGITGQLFRQFALVIAATALISALNALTLKPTQCALYLRAKKEGYRPNAFYRAFNRVYGAVENFYIGVVSWMAHRTGLMLLVFVTIIAIGGWQFARHPTGFLPTEDQGYCIAVTKLPDGASQPRARAVVDKINAIVSQEPGVAGWVTIGGLSILDGANLSTAVTTFVTYKPWNERGAALSQDHIVGSLQQKLAQIQDAFIFVVIPPPIRGLGQAGGFQMMVEDRASLGINELDKATQELIRTASTQTGIARGLATTFSARSPQLYLEIDRTKAESLGVSLNDVFDTLQGYLGSSFVNLFNKFNQVFQVYIQAESAFRLQPEDIKNLYVRNDKGEVVPLGTMLTVHPMLSSELITRYNLYPAAAVFGAAAPGFSSGEALNLMEQVAENVLPAGMNFDWTATAFQEKAIGNTAYFIYALSLTLVFLVLAAQYESWTSPAAVILVVPMALVGVLLALMIRGFDNNLYTQVGLVLMIALAAKNAILIVEFARELRAEGMPIVDAAVEATRRRFRPIVMTSFAFILGVLPMATASGAGAASQQALGTVVVGGMLASTLFAIPFVPVFYITMQRLSERRAAKKAPPAAGAAPPALPTATGKAERTPAE